MIRTFLYSLSFLISLSAITTQAQVKDSIRKPAADTIARKVAPARDTTHKLVAKPLPVKDSSYTTTSGGLRIGLDISRFALKFFQPYRTDITIQADAQLNKRLFAALETGFNRTSHSDTNYTYKGSGAFVTVGVDYDFLKKREAGEKNMVYGGIRYGFAHNTYEVPAYNIHSSYWDSNLNGTYPKTSVSAHWIELVFGLRVEVLKNFFLGWGVREKIMVSNSASKEFPPIVIPGFGSGTKKSQFDMTYTVSYYFPLYKIKIPVPKGPAKK
ncbi:hypothetical protein SAMN05518672_1011226 [Chitinophaga sp. CF118]|uniref:DUF6048 family protein n=1 Tax=Chitinophaga sp. CF118 TaxID=1884367 RepID=UPI0008E2B409|nr:DUF6048 family protein [Chitinophaga sp. CF118]SFD24344.1 hypothetical protein SAMN05518672_1011226 [Chitinophaga sp. CF118]